MKVTPMHDPNITPGQERSVAVLEVTDSENEDEEKALEEEVARTLFDPRERENQDLPPGWVFDFDNKVYRNAFLKKESRVVPVWFKENDLVEFRDTKNRDLSHK